MNKALIIVDVQNDFCSRGKYPVPKGEEVVEPLNNLIKHAKEYGWVIVASRDWHPEGESHCVRNTKGAEFHPDLLTDNSFVFVVKGEFDVSEKHYSAFNGENLDLKQILKDKNVDEVYVGGLAADYCVKNTALDAVKYGFITSVVWEATRGVFKKATEAETKKVLEENEVNIASLEYVLGEMMSDDVLSLLELMSNKGILMWIDGGWGVDALLGQQTRIHEDVDIVVTKQDLGQLRQILGEKGFVQINRDDNREWNFVLGDNDNHRIDVHVIEFDRRGNGIYGPKENVVMYPAYAFGGVGEITGRTVKCLTAEYQIESHRGYKIRTKDLNDVMAICKKFNIPVPQDYLSETNRW